MALPKISPTNAALLKALGDFLTGLLPPGTEVVVAQVNRVPEVQSPDYVLMTPLSSDRLATNIDAPIDCAFTASLTGTALTVSAVLLGSIVLGNTLLGVGVPVGASIVSQTSGTPGGVGAYVVSVPATVGSSKMASGELDMLQEIEATVQLDIHGPNSADNARLISTAFRDDYAVQAFAALNSNVSPLYADDPLQVPFMNDQDQYENRWVVKARMQFNVTAVVSQAFMDVITIGLQPVQRLGGYGQPP